MVSEVKESNIFLPTNCGQFSSDELWTIFGLFLMDFMKSLVHLWTISSEFKAFFPKRADSVHS